VKLHAILSSSDVLQIPSVPLNIPALGTVLSGV
jgi:hypothetical protein